MLACELTCQFKLTVTLQALHFARPASMLHCSPFYEDKYESLLQPYVIRPLGAHHQMSVWFY